MSRMSSMPTDSRTSSGVTPVAGLLLHRKLLVRRRCRMNHQRLGIANVRHQREQLQRIDQLLPCLVAAFDAECDQRPMPVGQILLRRACSTGSTPAPDNSPTPRPDAAPDALPRPARSASAAPAADAAFQFPADSRNALNGESAAPVSRKPLNARLQDERQRPERLRSRTGRDRRDRAR